MINILLNQRTCPQLLHTEMLEEESFLCQNKEKFLSATTPIPQVKQKSLNYTTWGFFLAGGTVLSHLL